MNTIKACDSETPFEVNSGSRQGNALSPDLFNSGLEKVTKELKRAQRMEVFGEETILGSRVDDTVVLGNARQVVTQTMSDLSRFGENMGPSVDEEKSIYTINDNA